VYSLHHFKQRFARQARARQRQRLGKRLHLERQEQIHRELHVWPARAAQVKPLLAIRTQHRLDALGVCVSPPTINTLAFFRSQVRRSQALPEIRAPCAAAAAARGAPVRGNRA